MALQIEKRARVVAAGVVLGALAIAYLARPCGALCTEAFWERKPTADEISRELTVFVNVNARSPEQEWMFPLHLALRYGSTAGVERLLKAGADPNRMGEFVTPPLVIAARFGSVEDVRLLLKAGADPTRWADSWQSDTALHVAAHYGSPEMLAVLIEAGAEIEARSGRKRDGSTPLHEAASGQKPQNVRFLIGAGADVEPVCPHGAPLAVAASRGPLDSVTALLEAGANAAGCEGGSVPIHSASRDPAIVKALLDAGASATVVDARGDTALHSAAQFGDFDSLSLLLQAGADARAKDESGKTPLHRAAEGSNLGRSRHIAALIGAGANVDAIDNDQRAPIHIAVEVKGRTEKHYQRESAIHAESVSALIAGGADIERPDKDGATPYLLAARFGSPEIMRLLAGAGARTDIRGQRDRVALHYAASSEHADKIAALIADGAQLDPKDKDGVTPLHLAAAERDPAKAELLIKAGASVSALDNFAQTALHYAARYGSGETVMLLLEAGANPDLRNTQGYTALQMGFNNRRLRSSAAYRALTEQTTDKTLR